MAALLSYDPYTGIKEEFQGNGDGSFQIRTSQDCGRILRFNKACQNEPRLRAHGAKQEFMHFARIPLTVALKWKNELGIDWNRKEDLPKIEKLLMSSEYKFLRTVDRI